MPSLTVGRSSLYYEVHGDGPPVVLAHGVGGNHAIWYQQTVALSLSHTIILFDHRGFGRSSDVEGFGRRAFATDLAAILDHLAIDRAALVGQSMGAGTCIGLAATAPQRVSALIIASSLHALVEPADVHAMMEKARQASANLDQLERVMGAEFRRMHPEAATLYKAINSFNDVDRRTLTGAWPNPISPEALGALGFPILFIAAADDVIFPIAAIRAMHARVAGARLLEVEACGHSVFFERPALFNAAVLEFLAAAEAETHRSVR